MSDEPVFDSVVARAYPMELPNVGSWDTPPRIGADLARRVRACLADLPWYVITPFLRHWHRTWGATSTEAAAEMPGDDLLPRAQYTCTRAINIDASPAEVWPWLVQVGYRRGGWYAGDLLDNFARPSVRRIVPELQDQRVGQWLSMVPNPSERTAFMVDSYEESSWLLWRTPNRSWAWRLIPLPGGRTRLVNTTGYVVAVPTALFILLLWAVHRPIVDRPVLGLCATQAGVGATLAAPLVANQAGLPIVVGASRIREDGGEDPELHPRRGLSGGLKDPSRRVIQMVVTRDPVCELVGS